MKLRVGLTVLLELTHELETAISENLIQIFKKYADDNSKETSTSGSLETIRSQAEMPKK